MIKVNNREIDANIDKLTSSTIPNALEQALTKAALIVEASAKKNAPVQTGTLRNSITHSVDKAKLEAVIGSNLDYAPYVEKGTGIHAEGGRVGGWTFYSERLGQYVHTEGNAPRPFLEPAVTENVSKIIQCFEDILK